MKNQTIPKITHIEGSEIQDLGSLHHYRTEIPNIIFHLNLDPLAFKAYCVLKMTAGDKGSCFKSNTTLSEEIGCSIPTWIKIKAQLEEEGLIILTKRKHENGGNMSDLIQIVNIWEFNMQTMSKLYPVKENNLKLRKKVNSNLSEGGKPDLLGGVNAVNEGGKPDLLGGVNAVNTNKITKQQDHKEEVVCVTAPPVAASPPLITNEVVKLMADKTEKKVKKSDFYTWCVMNNKNYTTDEIEDGWKIFFEYRSPLRDCFRFLEGTIDNLRKMKKIKEMNGEKECPRKNKKELMKQETKAQLENFKEPTTEKDTWGLHLADWKSLVMPAKRLLPT